LAAGLKRFFTGLACDHGHICQRQTSNKECVACSSERGLKRLYSDEELARKKAYREANRDRINEYRRSTIERARAKRSAIVKRWQESEKGKAWLANYEETKRAIVRNRRAKQRSSPGQHTAADIAAILKLQRGRCAYCREPVGKKFHVDHIKSVNQGGSNDRRNLQITCAFCNESKSDRDPIDHAQRLGKLL
jgi:5-methylcytosine-specific restriction endonuclease McrA